MPDRGRFVPTVLLVGHFSPPMHGMAAAMDALSNIVEAHGTVIRIRTVPRRAIPRALHHLVRIGLVLRALRKLLMARKSSAAVVFSVDAGHGMVYTAALVAAARLCGYAVTLQHHSYAYIMRRSTLMTAIVRFGGRSTTHIFYRDLMRFAFQRVYPGASTSEIMSIAYAAPQRPRSTRLRRRGKSTVVLGHMSNLTIEKGLEDAVAVGREAVVAGLAERLVLAGPISGPRERNLLASAEAEGFMEYRGPVYGLEKARFFDDIDVFLFPSRRYANEAYPLVVWEAMLAGVPVIGFRVGCLTQDVVGPGSLLMEPSTDFTAGALDQLLRWASSPPLLEQARADTRAAGDAEYQLGLAQARATAERLLEQRRPRTARSN
jgi:glycosyltransferase involved in cell wall biosynthesis